ncbi:ParA family protein [Methylobacterium sp. sgz302541]|uniref:ParA family protein n=1 Tax=unclassified Methylobacterium TaxID=2615210 RepID=UPI003D336FA2
MYVVTMASRKGGAGKSTLSILLSAMFAHANLRAVLIDCDVGQYTAHVWASQRNGAPPQVVAVEDAAELERAVARARAEQADFCIIDTPAGAAPVTDAAVLAADIVVIPTKCDVADRWAVGTTVEAVEVTGKPFLIVPTEVPARRLGIEASDLRRLRHDLADFDDVLWEGQITDRRAISYDLADGRVPSESDWGGATNKECLALWRRIMDVLQETPPPPGPA